MIDNMAIMIDNKEIAANFCNNSLVQWELLQKLAAISHFIF